MAMTNKKSQEDKLLNDVFNAASGDPEMQPDPAFLARMSEMAAAEARLLGQRHPVPPQNMAGRLLEAIGGWIAVAGLATATVAGVWIGAVQPDAFISFSVEDVETVEFYELGDLLPGYGGDLLQEEG